MKQVNDDNDDDDDDDDDDETMQVATQVGKWSKSNLESVTEANLANKRVKEVPATWNKENNESDWNVNKPLLDNRLKTLFISAETRPRLNVELTHQPFYLNH